MLDFSSLRRAGLRCLGLRRLPLKLILIGPLVVQLSVLIAAMVAIASHQGRIAVTQTIERLQAELTQRIAAEIDDYLEDAHTATQLSAAEIRLGHLDLEDSEAIHRYLFTQMQQFEQLGYTAIASETGNYVGIGRIGDGSEILLDWFGETGAFEKWELDRDGMTIELEESRNDYDPRTRPWYRAAVDQGEATWSEVFQYYGSKWPVISANRPLFNPAGELIGVASADLRLDQMSEFLGSLEISENGEAFVLDAQGHSLGSSTIERAYRRPSSLLQATESEIPLVRDVSQQLLEQQDGLPLAQSKHVLEVEGDRVLVQTQPYADAYGLEWTIVVVVPERDFMQPIWTMSRRVSRIAAIALGLSIVVGIATARKIAAPIKALAKASRTLALQFEPEATSNSFHRSTASTVPPQTIREFHLLATTFAQMAGRLQASFQQLAGMNQELEDRVQERTRELQQANLELQRLASIDGLTQISNRRRFDECFAACWHDALDRHQSLTIVLCDVDHFKQFNDTYGHQAGDDCLKQVAQAIEQAVSQSTGERRGNHTALAARYGGEEFVLLLPNTTADQAQAVTEAVQAEVKTLAIPHGRSSAGTIVSLSLGIAVIAPEMMAMSSLDQALVAADRALYEAKRSGRNGYRFAIQTDLIPDQSPDRTPDRTPDQTPDRIQADPVTSTTSMIATAINDDRVDLPLDV